MPLLEKDNIEIGRPWAQSLCQLLSFVGRMKTTIKKRIPVGAQKEAELKLLYQIVSYVEKYRILPSLIINLDQTPSKYV